MKDSDLEVGDNAPDFSATAIGGEYGDGAQVSLKEFKGRKVALYFYPKDNTPGCTIQACALRDMWKECAKTGAAVFGVSIDSATSHQKFIQKYTLPFPLLVDEDKTLANAYGVWVKKSMFAIKFMGTERSTFVIGADGKIEAIFRKVKPGKHAELLLEALRK